MLLSQERLQQLKEQQTYLEVMYDFAYDEHVVRLGKLGVPSERIEAEAIIETDLQWAECGLHTAKARIDLEIRFLTEQLN